MSLHLPKDFAVQSETVEAIHRVSIGGGALALWAACDGTGADLVRVTGLRPDRYYVLTGAAHRFVRANTDGEALVAIRSDAPALITLVPVI